MEARLLFTRINSLPEIIQKEALDFIDFLLYKYRNDKNRKEVTAKKKRSRVGFLKGAFVMKEGFDDPLEDFKEYM